MTSQYDEEWFKNWFDLDYALIYSHRDNAEAEQAVNLLLKIAPELKSGLVVDIGCGSGRHLTAFRKLNSRCFGLDLSADLLSLAPIELRPGLIRGDMRRLPFRSGSLAGACLWFTSFGYFSDEENRTLISSLYRILQTGGILLIDYLNSSHVLNNLVTFDSLEYAGYQVENHRRIEGSRVVKRVKLRNIRSGQFRQVVESVRLYSPEEMRTMARDCGFQLYASAGGYAGENFESSSHRWIGVFKK